MAGWRGKPRVTWATVWIRPIGIPRCLSAGLEILFAMGIALGTQALACKILLPQPHGSPVCFGSLQHGCPMPTVLSVTNFREVTTAAIVRWSGAGPHANAIKMRFSRQACSILRAARSPRAYANTITVSNILGSAARQPGSSSLSRLSKIAVSLRRATRAWRATSKVPGRSWFSQATAISTVCGSSSLL
jgi:hypothetical protein